MHAQDLTTLVNHRARTAVRRAELAPGDRLLVQTRNSWYTILPLGRDLYDVSGGWFDRQERKPEPTTISGCTFGGRAIDTRVVAGQGLFLEFGNKVTTTRIQHVCLIRSAERLTSRTR